MRGHHNQIDVEFFSRTHNGIGWMAEHGADRSVPLAFLAFVGGQLLIFAFGLAGLKISVGESWSWTIHNGFTIFIFGGLVNAWSVDARSQCR